MVLGTLGVWGFFDRMTGHSATLVGAAVIVVICLGDLLGHLLTDGAVAAPLMFSLLVCLIFFGEYRNPPEHHYPPKHHNPPMQARKEVL